jgi:multidrug resistance efflux pump
VKFARERSCETGETLVEIEPQRYRLAVTAAQANVEKGDGRPLRRTSRPWSAAKAVVEKNPGLIRGEEIATWRDARPDRSRRRSLRHGQRSSRPS